MHKTFSRAPNKRNRVVKFRKKGSNLTIKMPKGANLRLIRQNTIYCTFRVTLYVNIRIIKVIWNTKTFKNTQVCSTEGELESCLIKAKMTSSLWFLNNPHTPTALESR